MAVAFDIAYGTPRDEFKARHDVCIAIWHFGLRE